MQKLISFFLFLIITCTVLAQRPVQVIPSVLPPYSTLLSEYYSGTQERLKVMLINTDVAQPFLQCYLKVSVEGQGVNLQSTPYGNYPTIDLINGAPVTVSQSDLAPYFNPQHLIGNGAGNQNRLPEGLYNFCFEVYEKNTNRLIGDKQCAQAYLTLSDPAFLTLPEKGKVISYTNPFNLLFQWTPRHLSNPNAFNTEYQFDLVEIWDEGIAPEAAFYTAKPVYTTKLNTTNLFYGPGEPQLLSGKKYAWRVKTSMPTASNGQEPFKNEGYSEIFWFKLQGECPSLQRATVVSDPRTNRTTLSWSMDATSIGSTKLDYRKKGTSRWTTVESENNQTTINGLAWNTDYEYQLGNRCVITDDFGYGAVQTFKTLTQDTANCLPKAPTPLSNQEPLTMLRMGDTIYASGFQMRIREVSGANGTFSGNGYLALMVPTTTTEVSVQASFTNLGVNTDKQVISGKIVSLYDPSGANIIDANIDNKGGVNVGEVKTGNTTAVPVNTVIDPTATAFISPVVTGSGDTTYTVTITGTDGKPVTIQTKKVPVVVQDTKGDIYEIDKTGKVTAVGNANLAILGGLTPEELNALSLDKGIVTFDKHPDQQYALDIYQEAYGQSMLFTEEYERLSNGKYRVASKLLISNSSDKVSVKISNLKRGWKADSIHFVTGKGIEFKATKEGNNYEITVLSGQAGDAQELYAVYKDGNKTVTLGKLKIATYEPKEYKVNLVPVGNAEIDHSSVEEKLNEIYNPIGISWTVELKDPMLVSEAWDLDKDGTLNITGAGKYNKYSEEMKLLNATYIQSTSDLNASEAYLFVFANSPKAGSEERGRGMLGDMLRNKQFGYIFQPADKVGQVIAHELAHGVFHLEHTFASQYHLNEGDLPENLMDYRGGTELAKMQWDAIHKPALVMSAFEKEGDAALYYNFITSFFSKCLDDYKNQQTGFIPRCLWDHDQNVPYTPADLSLVAGLLDGAIETGDGMVKLKGFLDCYDISKFYNFWSDNCKNTYTQTYGVLSQLIDLWGNSEKQELVFSELGKSLTAYSNETAAVNNQARYNHGKIVFNVASLFIGAGEAKAIMKGEQTLMQVITASMKAYAGLPRSLSQLIAKGAIRASNRTGAYIALSTGNKGAYLAYELANIEIKIASLTSQQVLAEIKWAQGLGSVVKRLDDVSYINKTGQKVVGDLEIVKDGAGKYALREVSDIDLVNNNLIAELNSNGINFTANNLKFVAKNNDNFIMFLENGNSSSGLQHIINGKWIAKPNFQTLFNNDIDEMVTNMFKAINEGNYVSKIIDNQNRLAYIYKVQTTQGLKEFKIATGSNGYIVSFIPNWL